MLGEEGHQFLEKIKSIQSLILEYIDNENNLEENYQNLANIFNDIKIHDNFNEFKLILYFISNISVHHHRTHDFLQKIYKIIIFFEKDIKKNYSNYEIFHIFRKSKIILLYLIKQNILNIDLSIFNEIKKYFYINYFFPEVKKFIKNDQLVQDITKKLPKDYEEKRQIGENEDEICKIIRKDSLEEFISYVEKTKKSLRSLVDESIFETNLYLLKERPTLIEYAAFFGSIEIFKYLCSKKVKITKTIWQYAVHSNNTKLIQFLEEKKLKLNNANSSSDDDNGEVADDDNDEEESSNNKVYVKTVTLSLKDHINYPNIDKIPDDFEQLCGHTYEYKTTDPDDDFQLKKEDKKEVSLNDLFDSIYQEKTVDEEEEDEDGEESENEISSDYCDKYDDFDDFHHTQDDLCIQSFILSIIFQSNEIAEHINNKYLKNKDYDLEGILLQSLRYYNFAFINEELITNSTFFDFCQYDYYYFVKIMLNQTGIDVNSLKILSIVFCNV
ncbi:hypothetical protein M9Y10_026962 [Tritrichomonas musculus]|uniref:DUF3447 domain-containing protein n=1 Tax=Tritrichomonas musculus TaxID=1915356 RepID=A0ABR2H544_9EUKA